MFVPILVSSVLGAMRRQTEPVGPAYIEGKGRKSESIMPRSNVKRRTNGNITKDKILDAAENLFSVRGFDAVSLRDITDKADVTLALASYHFGDQREALRIRRGA